MTAVATIMVVMTAIVTAILVAIVCYLDGKREQRLSGQPTDVEISGVPAKDAKQPHGNDRNEQGVS